MVAQITADHNLVAGRNKGGIKMNPEDRNENSSMQAEVTGASMARIENGLANPPDGDPEIDDRGTGQSEAAQILTKIRDGAFDSSDENLALALGRPIDEIQEWIRGAQTIDGDVLQKARALGLERGLQIE
jgi:hypothetical protein